MANTKRIELKNIKTTFYVRMRLDHDRVLFFQDLYESGINIEPIMIWESSKDHYELIDGRHRLEALRNGGYNWTKCELVNVKTRAEAIVLALAANLGGSLPPTQGDIEHVIEMLMNEGWSRSDIIEQINLPEYLAKKMYKLTLSKIHKRKAREAAALVRDKRMSTLEAAKQVGIPEQEVKVALGAVIGRVGDKDVSAFLKAFETRLRGLSMITSKHTEMLHDLYSSGEIEANDIAQYIDRIKASAKRVGRTLQDAQDRLDKLIHPEPLVQSPEEFKEFTEAQRQAIQKREVLIPERVEPTNGKAKRGRKGILKGAVLEIINKATSPMEAAEIADKLPEVGVILNTDKAKGRTATQAVWHTLHKYPEIAKRFIKDKHTYYVKHSSQATN